ncbi:uncharacterized protein BDR25DRAFT_356272 [Lindgomyces ingoldianus]|uniref:Uncharacterized protein n=1 Tax=Lindgomyces ingoldianus TaxID=673940 RepID=A0ACB6QTQ7_9PLEO|nr:uncharacterized protein BDR25DRAFT_356272 [Lindgomyces ingoldianus]KAF2469551.1 hypothetical protein BDR25DRAFT_356272 [Lindgomyces ingoldianus]
MQIVVNKPENELPPRHTQAAKDRWKFIRLIVLDYAFWERLSILVECTSEGVANIRIFQVARDYYSPHNVFRLAGDSPRVERPVDITTRVWLEIDAFLAERFGSAHAAAPVYKELQDLYNRKGYFGGEDCSSSLKDLAIYALSINPTSAAAERNWSTNGVSKMPRLVPPQLRRDASTTERVAYFSRG